MEEVKSQDNNDNDDTSDTMSEGVDVELGWRWLV